MPARSEVCSCAGVLPRSAARQLATAVKRTPAHGRGLAARRERQAAPTVDVLSARVALRPREGSDAIEASAFVGQVTGVLHDRGAHQRWASRGSNLATASAPTPVRNPCRGSTAHAAGRPHGICARRSRSRAARAELSAQRRPAARAHTISSACHCTSAWSLAPPRAARIPVVPPGRSPVRRYRRGRRASFMVAIGRRSCIRSGRCRQRCGGCAVTFREHRDLAVLRGRKEELRMRLHGPAERSEVLSKGLLGALGPLPHARIAARRCADVHVQVRARAQLVKRRRSVAVAHAPRAHAVSPALTSTSCALSQRNARGVRAPLRGSLDGPPATVAAAPRRREGNCALADEDCAERPAACRNPATTVCPLGATSSARSPADRPLSAPGVRARARDRVRQRTARAAADACSRRRRWPWRWRSIRGRAPPSGRRGPLPRPALPLLHRPTGAAAPAPCADLAPSTARRLRGVPHMPMHSRTHFKPRTKAAAMQMER